ncbi:hypothetical protein ACETRX_35005 [Labrys portucalensis]|uniref:Transposase n=1 Tax=Labrys neptuniae TaxID=376174 RepID=A0ABV6ZRU1_9HYPH
MKLPKSAVSLADEIRIFEDGSLIASHPVLEGRHQRRVAPGHSKAMTTQRRWSEAGSPPVIRAGDVVAQRSLDFYDAIAQRLAQKNRP